MRSPTCSLILFAATSLAGCSTFKPPQISYDDPPQPAVLETEPPKPVQVVEVPKLLPLPGQLKPLPGSRSPPEPRDPRQRVDLANAAARVHPTRPGASTSADLSCPDFSHFSKPSDAICGSETTENRLTFGISVGGT